MDAGEVGHVAVEWIQMARNRMQWRGSEHGSELYDSIKVGNVWADKQLFGPSTMEGTR
jgi:hypothetical protein